MSLLLSSCMWWLNIYIVLAVAIPHKAPGQSSAAEVLPVILHDEQDMYIIGKHLQIQEDTTGKWTIDNVRSAAFSKGFKQSEEEVPNLGFSNTIYWLRFRMLDRRTIKESVLLEFDLANVDKVTLYFRNKQGLYQSKEAGFIVPFTTREVESRNPVFVIPASHTDSVLYLRIDPAAINVIPLSVYTNHAFAEKENTMQLMFGFLYGKIVIIIILSLVLYLLSKEVDFLYYFLYVCSLFCIFFWINGYAYQYLWPTATQFNYKIWVVFCVSMTLFLILFNQRFLRLSYYFPFLNKLFNGISLFYGLIAIDGLFFDRDRAIYMGSTAFTFVLLLVTIISLLCLRKGYKPAIYPFTAYLIILFCYIISFLMSITVLPHNTFIANSFFYGYICECIIFLVGVGYKLSISTREKELAQKKSFALDLERVELEKRQEMAQMKSDFYNNISHEFRTPLTLIISPVKKIIAETEDNHQHKQLFHTIHHYAGRLLHLVNQLLDIAKLEAKGMRLELQPVEIVSFVHHRASSFISLAESKHIDYQIMMSESHQWLYIDQDKTEKIINNLLSNAFKFTPQQGNVSVALEFIGHAKPDELLTQITVTDTGIGIAADQVSHIFDRFYQTPDVQPGQWQGTGIGLSLTKELIELYQGTITVISEPGKGSTFIVQLPLRKASLRGEELYPLAPFSGLKNEYSGEEEQNDVLEASMDEAMVTNASATSNASAGTETQTEYILLVEDHVQMRGFIKTIMLEKTGCQILEASNGEEGYKLALVTVPLLIIADSMLPLMSGPELCRKLKQHDITCHIPIILLTAKTSAESKIEGLQTGADDYITKPFEPDELITRVNNLIVSRKKLREQFSREIILQPAAITITSADEKFLQKAMQIVEEHMADATFSVESFSYEMGISRMQLLRKLKALTNHSPADFIRVMRLKRACELFTNKAGTIAEIAYQVGFNDPSYFAKSFYKQYGVTPSEFYAKVAGKH